MFHYLYYRLHLKFKHIYARKTNLIFVNLYQIRIQVFVNTLKHYLKFGLNMVYTWLKKRRNLVLMMLPEC